MTDTTHPAPTSARRYGFTAEQLAVRPTVFRGDLLAGQRYIVSGGGSGSGMGRASVQPAGCRAVPRAGTR